MRRILLIVALVLGIATPVAAARPTTGVSSIVLNEIGPLAFQDTVTFTTTVERLKGAEYPMIVVECTSVVTGEVLYAQLDHPDTVFVLGGGSSPWWLQRDDAICVGELYAYGGTYHGNDTIRLLDYTPTFLVEG